MTKEEFKDLCRKEGITYLPHHRCGACGEHVGWYLFGQWPPYEVAFCHSCGCSCRDSAFESSWDEVLQWVLDDGGNLRDEYKKLLNI